MAKNIILCSDGTKNTWGYGNKTNVYKLYKAIDINDSEGTGVKQISFYSNGIGTSDSRFSIRGNKFWTAISGALGFGFEENVVELYEFLARHYQHGDPIFLFGFSRGAATVRALTGFVHTCGLIDKSKTTNENEFHILIYEAVCAYRKNKIAPDIALDFKKKHAVSGAGFAPKGNLKIHFVGVWDSVSALGFPKDGSILFDCFFSQLDRLSEEKWPHNYYNFRLNDEIEYACQALAIDDERKTFSPKVWIENGRKEYSVEQVWFAGTHSNVGGGDSRTGLSEISREWMMAQASKRGLVFICDDIDDFETYANVHDKLYDSRDGFGIYYRYEPRDIEALCKSRSSTVKIHETVIERIKSSTVHYAPGYLPREFELVSTDPSIAAKKVKFDQKKWTDCRQNVDELVNRRKILYYFFTESMVVIFALVIAFSKLPPDSIFPYMEDGGSDHLFFLQRWLYEMLIYILPPIFKNFITYIVCVHFWIFVIMIANLYSLFKIQENFIIELEKALTKTRYFLLDTL